MARPFTHPPPLLMAQPLRGELFFLRLPLLEGYFFVSKRLFMVFIMVTFWLSMVYIFG